MLITLSVSKPVNDEFAIEILSGRAALSPREDTGLCVHKCVCDSQSAVQVACLVWAHPQTRGEHSAPVWEGFPLLV